MTASPGRHETERRCCWNGSQVDTDRGCRGCPYATPPAAPPPDEGETERRWLSEETEAEKLARWARRREAVALMHASTPPVVGDQPEETDTVNDSLLDRHLASLAEQMTTIDAKHQRNPYRIPFRDESRWLGDREHELRLHQEDLAAVTAMQAELAALATSPAVGAEVRVEWGVRYDAAPDSLTECKASEAQARSIVRYHATNANYPSFLVRRTITTYPDGSFLTEAWAPVTDDGL